MGNDVLAWVILLGENDALQAGVNGEAENVHVELADHVGDGRVDDEGHDRRDVLVHRLEQEEARGCGRRHDEDEADVVDQAPQHGHGAEAQDVGRDDFEGLPGGVAEVRAADRDLDVRVLAQELEALLEAPDAALQGPEDDDHDPIFLGRGLLLQVHHHVADELHQGDDAGAEREGARVVAEDVPDRRLDCGILALLTVRREEPGGDGAGDDALSDRDEEGVVPEEREERVRELVVQDVPRRPAPPAPRRDARGVAVDAAAGVVGIQRVAGVTPGEALRPLVVAHGGLLVGRVGVLLPGGDVALRDL
mmetsp:Transcript_8137/g.17775  ORF Transcript_8137/g.17775 Transcript_8137/m.17775 type:complete len:307 (-) Transcript_8137:2001-2921(-)